MYIVVPYYFTFAVMKEVLPLTLKFQKIFGNLYLHQIDIETDENFTTSPKTDY